MTEMIQKASEVKENIQEKFKEMVPSMDNLIQENTAQVPEIPSLSNAIDDIKKTDPALKSGGAGFSLNGK